MVKEYAPRKCTNCGSTGHDFRTCNEKGKSVRLFGVDIGSKPIVKRRCNAATAIGRKIRKMGIPWTEEEHRKFLQGLKKLGKGAWKGISENYVISRTPTQVASHAQKYLKRQSSSSAENNNSNKRRGKSLFDITSTQSEDDSSVCLQVPESQQHLQPSVCPANTSSHATTSSALPLKTHSEILSNAIHQAKGGFHHPSSVHDPSIMYSAQTAMWHHFLATCRDLAAAKAMPCFLPTY